MQWITKNLGIYLLMFSVEELLSFWGNFCSEQLKHLLGQNSPEVLIIDRCLCLVAQSCLTLCHPKDCSLPGFSVHGDSPGENTGVGCHALLQGIFPTQGSNPSLSHCRRILYCLSHQGSPDRQVDILNANEDRGIANSHESKLSSMIFFFCAQG